jgi:hypothetical protein
MSLQLLIIIIYLIFWPRFKVYLCDIGCFSVKEGSLYPHNRETFVRQERKDILMNFAQRVGSGGARKIILGFTKLRGKLNKE